MTSYASELSATAHPRIADIPAADWDSCAGTENPFLSHAFLSALEDSRSVGARSGWQPQHLVLRDRAGQVMACAPAYLKSHSSGEYVFDHGWADAYNRAGGRYYPKLQCCVPFTPVPGPRLLLHSQAPEGTRETLIQALVALAEAQNASSVHVTFPRKAEWEGLAEAGFLQRIGTQFHWDNEGYAGFEDFLAALSSRKRKQIRKERREAMEGGIEINSLTGNDLKPAHWDAFYKLYCTTTDRKWGSAYLTRAFFHLLSERMADRVLLVLAERDGEIIAGALNLIGTDTLYGRNWGADGDYKFLHFEVCYYRAIDFAIARGLKRVEAGAQGTHKIQRGYLPQATYSAHFIRDPALARAVAQFLDRERPAMQAEIDALAEYSPFKEEP